MLSLFADRDGVLWFGTGSGVSRYDGHTWAPFSTEDGLAHNAAISIMQDRRGHLWFGTFDGGVSWYDGQTWGTFTTQNGLANDWVWSMVQDGEGHFWFTTNGGISRYDWHVFTVFTRIDGLGHDRVLSIQQDRRGHLWFGTQGGGVSRYDGQTFTTADGLGGNMVVPISTLFKLNKEHADILWIPEIELRSQGRSSKPDAEIDICCVCDGKIVIGECRKGIQTGQ